MYTSSDSHLESYVQIDFGIPTTERFAAGSAKTLRRILLAFNRRIDINFVVGVAPKFASGSGDAR
jgi:hypothetical protein